MEGNVNADPSGNPQQLVQLIGQLAAQLQEMRATQAAERETRAAEREAQAAEREAQAAEREAQREQIRLLQQALAPSNNAERIADAVNDPDPPDQTRPPLKIWKTRLPDPPKFDGTRRRFIPWFLEMQGKLQVDREAFGGDEELFAYIYARLDSTAQTMASAYYSHGGTDGKRSPDQFMTYLQRTYGDPNAEARALDRLRSLRQKDTESFASFFPKFEKELADSGGGTWEDKVRVNYLEGALNRTLRNLLICVPVIPKDYNEFVELLLTIGSRLDSQTYQDRYERRRRRPSTPDQAKPKTATSGNVDKVDWEPTKVNRSTVPNKAREKKRENFQKGDRRCYKCEEIGHLIRNCPRWEKAKIKKAAPKPAVNDSPTGSSEPESDQTSEDSGKE
ncbi:hypothetical protein ColLi_13877 [Colletotrichum liriopes]|uniref:CCHC-type domain-containing protein n=1 Tax=Colletotrichum liriopes TaxID=708192 RepID=A0AA37H1Z9_9PEZI|nr:hypothetical protein ColLi_13877 [Colletotrichum liriopes]